jgi:hypothetical protein
MKLESKEFFPSYRHAMAFSFDVRTFHEGFSLAALFLTVVKFHYKKLNAQKRKKAFSSRSMRREQCEWEGMGKYRNNNFNVTHAELLN